MFKRVLFILAILAPFVIGVEKESRFDLKVEMKFKKVNFSQMNQVEREVRAIKIYDANGKEIECEIKIKPD